MKSRAVSLEGLFYGLCYLMSLLLVDIFMLIEKSDIFNLADDNTIYDCGEDLSNVLVNL